jgi:hypothetical protein
VEVDVFEAGGHTTYPEHCGAKIRMKDTNYTKIEPRIDIVVCMDRGLKCK